MEKVRDKLLPFFGIILPIVGDKLLPFFPAQDFISSLGTNCYLLKSLKIFSESSWVSDKKKSSNFFFNYFLVINIKVVFNQVVIVVGLFLGILLIVYQLFITKNLGQIVTFLGTNYYLSRTNYYLSRTNCYLFHLFGTNCYLVKYLFFSHLKKICFFEN